MLSPVGHPTGSEQAGPKSVSVQTLAAFPAHGLLFSQVFPIQVPVVGSSICCALQPAGMAEQPLKVN
jgi:hypothetical protein